MDFKNLKKPPAKAGTYSDSKCTGLVLRVYGSGTAVYFAQVQTGGKRIRRKLGAFSDISPGQARIRLQELRNELESGNLSDGSELSLKNCFLMFLDDRARHDKKPSTLRHYKKTFQNLEPYHSLPISQFTSQLCHVIHAAEKRRIFDATAKEKRDSYTGSVGANHTLRTLSAVLSYAERLELVGKNAARLVTKYKEKPRISEFKLEHVPALLEVMRDVYKSPPPNRDVRPSILFLEFLIYTAARKGTLQNIAWTDVDLTTGELLCRDTKNRSDYTIFLAKQLKPRLSELAKYKKTGHIFPFLDPKKTLKSLCKLAEVPAATPHDLRKASSLALDVLAVPVSVANAIKMHRGDKLQQAYLQPSDDQIRQAYQNLADYISGLK